MGAGSSFSALDDPAADHSDGHSTSFVLQRDLEGIVAKLRQAPYDLVGGRAVTEQAASTSQMGRFETEAMTSAENLTALADLSGRWIDPCKRGGRGRRLCWTSTAA